MPLSPKLMLGAAAIFVAMFLMRLTLRTSRRARPDGIRWRGIDWSQVKRPPADAPTEDAGATGGSRSSASRDSDASADG